MMKGIYKHKAMYTAVVLKEVAQVRRMFSIIELCEMLGIREDVLFDALRIGKERGMFDYEFR